MKRLIPPLASAAAALCAVAALSGCVAYPSGAPAYGYDGGYYDGYGAPAYGYAEPPVQSSLFLGFGGSSRPDYDRRYWGRGYDHGYHGDRGNWNGHGGNNGNPHGPPPQAGGPPPNGGGQGGWHGNHPPPQAGGGQPQGGGNRGGGQAPPPPPRGTGSQAWSDGVRPH
jgi:hypothetical protein